MGLTAGKCRGSHPPMRQLRGVSDERDEVIAQDWKRVEQAQENSWEISFPGGGGGWTWIRPGGG